MIIKYALSEDQVSFTLQEENVILQHNKGVYYSMNEVGTFIWDLLKTAPLQLEEIIEHVQESFDVDKEVCKQDVETLIETLIKAELVVQVS